MPTRVLIVDDLPANRETIQEWLAEKSIFCKGAKDPIEALRTLTEAQQQGAPFDLVLLDTSLPAPGFESFAAAAHFTGTPPPRLIALALNFSSRLMDRLGKAGCTAFIRKPLVRPSQLLEAIASAASHRPHPAAANVSEPRARKFSDEIILLVEDNPVNQKVGIAMIQALGYEVELAENGNDAVNLARNRRYGLILMDCQMPGMDGLEATRQIRKLDGPSIPIVALTANAFESNREECLAAGMDAFLAKPVQKSDLAKMIKEWFGASKSRPANLAQG